MLQKFTIVTEPLYYPEAKKHIVLHPTRDVWTEVCPHCSYQWVIRGMFRPQRCPQCRRGIGNGRKKHNKIPFDGYPQVWKCSRCGNEWGILGLRKPKECCGDVPTDGCSSRYWDIARIRKNWPHKTKVRK
jgi:hypothetical protein